MPRRKKSEVTREKVVEALAQIACDEPDVKPGERMKALELLGKPLGHLGDRTMISHAELKSVLGI